MSKVKTGNKYYHNKLVRDKIPKYIESRGGFYETSTLKIGEFRTQLKKKAIEEAKEIASAKKDELVNEMADLLQILRSIAKLEKIPFGNIEKARNKKEKERGAFNKRTFLIWSDKPKGEK